MWGEVGVVSSEYQGGWRVRLGCEDHLAWRGVGR